MVVRNILITGGSSGLGAALARRLARPGTRLILLGRDEARLGAVAAACRATGALAQTHGLELRDIGALTKMLAALDRDWPLDLVILNAGIGGTLEPGAADETTRTEQIAMVNFTVPVVAATFLGQAMLQRGQGHIVLIGSVAEFFPLPMAPGYAASKAGLAMFAESLQLRLERHNVAVTLVSPGFIDTPMNHKLNAPKPFLMSADAAADRIARRLTRRPARIVMPWQFAILGVVSRLLPRAMLRAILRRV
jgi:short-subunit dehydrogenase